DQQPVLHEAEHMREADHVIVRIAVLGGARAAADEEEIREVLGLKAQLKSRQVPAVLKQRPAERYAVPVQESAAAEHRGVERVLQRRLKWKRRDSPLIRQAGAAEVIIHVKRRDVVVHRLEIRSHERAFPAVASPPGVLALRRNQLTEGIRAA